MTTPEQLEADLKATCAPFLGAPMIETTVALIGDAIQRVIDSRFPGVSADGHIKVWADGSSINVSDPEGLLPRMSIGWDDLAEG